MSAIRPPLAVNHLGRLGGIGERIVAWVVPAELRDHMAKLSSPNKRVVRYLDALPRNEMGKVFKRDLSQWDCRRG